MVYKYILLDLDNTLYDTRSSEQLAVMTFLDEYFPVGDKNSLFTAYKELNHCQWKSLEEGKVSIENFNTERFRLFFEQNGIKKDPAAAGERYLELLCDNHLFYPFAKEIYQYLINKYQVALITNGLKAGEGA